MKILVNDQMSNELTLAATEIELRVESPVQA